MVVCSQTRCGGSGTVVCLSTGGSACVGMVPKFLLTLFGYWHPGLAVEFPPCQEQASECGTGAAGTMQALNPHIHALGLRDSDPSFWFSMPSPSIPFCVTTPLIIQHPVGLGQSLHWNNLNCQGSYLQAGEVGYLAAVSDL